LSAEIKNKKEKCWRERFAVIHKEERMFSKLFVSSASITDTHTHSEVRKIVYISSFLLFHRLTLNFNLRRKEKEFVRVVKELKEEFLKDSD
jgi:hypothetical protein